MDSVWTQEGELGSAVRNTHLFLFSWVCYAHSYISHVSLSFAINSSILFQHQFYPHCDFFVSSIHQSTFIVIAVEDAVSSQTFNSCLKDKVLAWKNMGAN